MRKSVFAHSTKIEIREPISQHGLPNSSEPDDFIIGRTAIMEQLLGWLKQNHKAPGSGRRHGCYLVTGVRGVGKTSFVNRVLFHYRKWLLWLYGDEVNQLDEIHLNLGAGKLTPFDVLKFLAEALHSRTRSSLLSPFFESTFLWITLFLAIAAASYSLTFIEPYLQKTMTDFGITAENRVKDSHANGKAHLTLLTKSLKTYVGAANIFSNPAPKCLDRMLDGVVRGISEVDRGPMTFLIFSPSREHAVFSQGLGASMKSFADYYAIRKATTTGAPPSGPWWRSFLSAFSLSWRRTDSTLQPTGSNKVRTGILCWDTASTEQPLVPKDRVRLSALLVPLPLVIFCLASLLPMARVLTHPILRRQEGRFGENLAILCGGSLLMLVGASFAQSFQLQGFFVFCLVVFGSIYLLVVFLKWIPPQRMHDPYRKLGHLTNDASGLLLFLILSSLVLHGRSP